MWNHYIMCTPETEAYWEAQSKYDDTTLQVAPGGTLLPCVTRCQVVWNRSSPAGLREDVAVTHFDFAFNDMAKFGRQMSNTEMATAEGKLDTWWTALKVYYDTSTILAGYRWQSYDSSSDKPGPAIRNTTKSVAGTASTGQAMPGQVSLNITYRTASRKHWGRSYLPAMVYFAVAPDYGRAETAYVDGIATATRTMFNDINTAVSFEPVVYSNRFNGALSLSELVMDDVFDTVRRRRAKSASYRKIFTS